MLLSPSVYKILRESSKRYVTYLDTNPSCFQTEYQSPILRLKNRLSYSENWD